MFVSSKIKWLGKVTVEPMLFLYFITLAISALVSTKINIINNYNAQLLFFNHVKILKYYVQISIICSFND